MTREEYTALFHRAEVNLVAFKQVNDCDAALKFMVEMAIKEERNRLADELQKMPLNDTANSIAIWIREGGNA